MLHSEIIGAWKSKLQNGQLKALVLHYLHVLLFLFIYFCRSCQTHGVKKPVLQSRRRTQPRSQGLSSLPPLVAGTETLVAAGHVTIYPSKTAGWVGTQVHLVETKTPLPHPSSRFFYHPDSGWSRDEPQSGSLFQRLRETEKRDPWNEVETNLAPWYNGNFFLQNRLSCFIRGYLLNIVWVKHLGIIEKWLLETRAKLDFQSSPVRANFRFSGKKSVAHKRVCLYCLKNGQGAFPTNKQFSVSVCKQELKFMSFSNDRCETNHGLS